MVLSMTGFGRSTGKASGFEVTVEVKTVNHRFNEFHFRMPRQLMKLENKLKSTIGTYMKRGRAEIFVTLTGQGAVRREVQVDWELLDEYIGYISEIKDKYSLHGDISIRDLVVKEDIVHIAEIETEDGLLEALVLETAERAAKEMQQMRLREGSVLEQDIYGRIKKLEEHVANVKERAPLVADYYRERISRRMADLAGGQIDSDRILAETAIFADKADINEELTRVASHTAQFYSMLKVEEPVGRKLDFLVQEMNREVNTIGSKANDSLIAMEVVEMKSLLEKVKEQVQNIE